MRPYNELRGSRRHNLALSAGLALGISRIVRLFVQVATVRLAITYLTREEYGLWLTVSSVVTYVTLTNLGTNNSVLNAVAEARGRNCESAIRSIASSGFFPLAVLTGTVGVGTSILLWVYRSRIPGGEAYPALWLLLVVSIWHSLASMLAGQIAAVQHGFQKEYSFHAWSAAGVSASLIGFWLVIRADWGLVAWAIAQCVAVQAFNVVNGILFLRTKPGLVSWSHVKYPVVKALLASGVIFAVTGLAQGALFAVDAPIIANTLGVDKVVGYAIPLQLCTFSITLLAGLIAGYRPALTEAISHGDAEWAQATTRRLVLMSGAGAGGIGVLIGLWGNSICTAWTGAQLSISPYVWLLLGAFSTISAWNFCLGTLIVAVNRLRPYAVTLSCEATAKLLGTLLLVPILGYAGAATASVLSATAVTGMVQPRILKRLDGNVGDLPYLRTFAISMMPAAMAALVGRAMEGIVSAWVPPSMVIPSGGCVALITFGVASAALWRLRDGQLLSKSVTA